MPLSDTFVRSVKPEAKVKKYSDGGGLHLRVEPTGSKLWRMQFTFDRKQKILAFGKYPSISLKDARGCRDAAKSLLAKGIDPTVHAKLERIRGAVASANTFSTVADELIAKDRREGRAPATLKKKEHLLSLARPSIGTRPIAEVSSAEVLSMLQKIERTGKHETACAVRSIVGQTFRFAIATARATNDPTFALRGALTTPRVRHYSAILDRKRFGELLRSIWGYEGDALIRGALKLMAYLYSRPGELRLAEWREFDLESMVWTIPAERTKMRREHTKPLPPQAIAILTDLRAISGDCALVFPSVRSRKRPISDMTTNAALRRMGYLKDEVTSHGFRASASTMLNQSGKWSVDAIERELAHVDASAVRRAYHRGDHFQERMLMAKWWADEVDTMRNGAEIINIADRALEAPTKVI